jgi:hypothetical protein
MKFIVTVLCAALSTVLCTISHAQDIEVEQTLLPVSKFVDWQASTGTNKVYRTSAKATRLVIYLGTNNMPVLVTAAMNNGSILSVSNNVAPFTNRVIATSISAILRTTVTKGTVIHPQDN